MSELVGGWAVALPNATWALRVALHTAGVRAGDDVLIPNLDWTAGRVAVVSLGARPVTVAVTEDSLTIDPRAAATACTSGTRAAVATHPHGICADVVALRDALPQQVAIVEDAAQALRASLRGHAAGSLGDAAVFSFGPGKLVDAGEMGILILRERDAFEEAVRSSQHPVRQKLTGISTPLLDGFAARAAPLSAVCAAHGLHRLQEDEALLRTADQGVRASLSTALPRARLLSHSEDRRGEPGTTAFFVPSENDEEAGNLPQQLERVGPIAIHHSSLVAAPAPPVMTLDSAQKLAERMYVAVQNQPTR